MRVLVCFGSKMGGTEGIAAAIVEELQNRAVTAVLQDAREVASLDGYDAVIVGGALYANRWNPDARRFMQRHTEALRKLPVWLFSSGPLDDSASRRPISAVRDVDVLMQRIGAQGHVTFGGWMPADASGFPASAMAKTHSGDWRDMEQVKRWTDDIAAALPTARGRPATEPASASAGRLIVHAVVGWAICALMLLLAPLVGAGWAEGIRAIAAPIVFAGVAVLYFGQPGAREPLPAAVGFTGIFVVLDALIVATFVAHGFGMFGDIVASWVPYVLVFLAIWAVGAIMAMIPQRGASG